MCLYNKGEHKYIFMVWKCFCVVCTQLLNQTRCYCFKTRLQLMSLTHFTQNMISKGLVCVDYYDTEVFFLNKE